MRASALLLLGALAGSPCLGTPASVPRAGEFRPVSVRVAGAGLRVKTAGGYDP